MALKECSTETGTLTDAQARLLRMLNSVSLEDEEASASVGTGAPSQVSTADATCTNCDNTETWGQSPWCPKCGFYPKLNRVMEGVAVREAEVDLDEELDINQILPPWTYSIIIGVVVLLIESVAIRLLVADLATRSSFAQFQIMVGLVVFILAHSKAYIIAAMASTKFTPGTAITQPMSIWGEVFKVLPQQKKVLRNAAWGMTAVFLGVAVIGLDWDGMFKSNQSSVPRINPFKWIMKTVVSISSAQARLQASQGVAASGMSGLQGGLSSNASLEEAIGSFADVAGADVLGAAGIGGGVVGPGGRAGAGGIGGMGSFSATENSEGMSGDLSGAISGFADVTGAQELSTGAFTPDTMTRGGMNTGGPGLPGSSGVGPASASFSTGGGAQSTGPNPAGTNPGGAQPSPGGTKLVSPIVVKKPVDSKAGSSSGTGAPQGEGAAGLANSTTAAGSGSGESPVTLNVPPGTETTDVLIFGYTTNFSGEIRSLLVAKMTGDNRARFVGRLSLDDVPQGTITELEKELEAIRTRTAAVSCPYGGRWVKPIIYCTVAHKGWTSDGRINDGKFINYHR